MLCKRFAPRAATLLLCLLAACDSASQTTRPDPVPPTTPAPQGTVEVWRTTPDRSLLLARDPRNATLAAAADVAGALTIALDPAQSFQAIEGFGAAVTGSSAFVMTEHLDDAARAALVDELFDPEKGIGLSYLRMTIGASDFSLRDYTYDDVPPGETDFGLDHFSIEPDRPHVIPVLQQIFGRYPDVGLMGSPWSPPAWMKTNGQMKGGSLRADAYPALAEYFARTVEAFGAEGIPIQSVTVQNEPEYAAPYPSMLMTAPEQAAFIGSHLGPLLEQRGLNTRILAYDHNWDHPEYPLAVLGDARAAPYVAGSAFHCYAGNVPAMGLVHNAYPDKSLYFTECSGGGWAPDFGETLGWMTTNLVVGTMRNWSQTVLLWNLALDETSGPTNNGCADCRGVVTINAQTGAVTRNVEYYVLGHAAKFVRPGARRIASTDVSGQQVQNVAFQNPDGRLALIAFNAAGAARLVQVRVGGQAFSYTLPAGALVTFRWRPN